MNVIKNKGIYIVYFKFVVHHQVILNVFSRAITMTELLFVFVKILPNRVVITNHKNTIS